MEQSIQTISKEDLPKQLHEIPQPAKQLHYIGTFPPKEHIYLTIVGSRKFTRYGKDVCEALIEGLKGYPITIVSGLALGIDTLAHETALSFVRSAREIRYLKSYIEQKKQGIQVIAKIEKSEALEELEEIIRASDAVMVARGDLGVEIGNENVPVWQKKIIRTAHRYAKPVITATQMLNSMVENPTPTRAEASDISNAVFDGSDALMLSNESSVGKYPIESVRTMSEIIVAAENYIRIEDNAENFLDEKNSECHTHFSSH
jgi:pyruvate kinase